MTYSDEYKVCWYTPQRTATRSTHSLLKVLNFVSLGTHSFNLPEEKMDYRLISNVRNPYSRLVSIYYLHGLHTNNFFEDFDNFCRVKLGNFKFQDDYQIDYDKKILSVGKEFYKFVKVENYVNDLKSLDFIDLTKPEVQECFTRIIEQNLYEQEFESLMGKKRKKWYEFYTQELADIVYQRFEDQFKLFNYEKDSWNYGTS
jgi:hypothetical protein